ADSAGEEGAGRWDRTGDLARYGSGGTIELVRRADHQVKLRGFRIEPGEIESVLNGHEAVHQSIVMLREDQPGERRLVGYVLKKTQHAEEMGMAEALRAYLKESLPEYMVPASVMVLSA